VRQGVESNEAIMSAPKLLSGNPRLDHYLLAIYAAGLAAAVAGLLADGTAPRTEHA